MTQRPLSRSVEDYLKAIYGLSRHGESATTSAVAESLDVQPASVTGMVKKLAEEELVTYAPYRGVRLTDKGTTAALQVLRRHRILETYLCDRLGYSWDDVHAEAERLEHTSSDLLIERMAAALGHPSHDPHGAPIPTPAGDIEATPTLTLADASPGDAFRIQAVRDEDAGELRSMAADGLVPGAQVRVTIGSPDGGVLSVLVGGDAGPALEVQDRLARRIFVTPEEAP